MNPLLVPLITAGLNAIKSYIPDPAQQAKAESDLLTAVTQQNAAQSSINLADAQSGDWFRAGWRPALGWVCVVSCFWNWLIVPFTGLLAKVFDSGDPGLVPADMSEMLPILLSLLGLGTLRTVERLNGKA